MTNDPAAFRDLKILIVEDAFLVAIDICAQLESLGCRIVGPAARLNTALKLATKEPLDGAFLDVNLAGELSFPVAAALDARNIPYVFMSGYDSADMFPPEYRDTLRLAKPFRQSELVEALADRISKRRSVKERRAERGRLGKLVNIAG